MSHAEKALIIVNDLYPTLESYRCVPTELIQEYIDKRGFTNYLSVKDIGRAIRVYTQIEYTACDNNFIPCMISGKPAALWLHPTRVKKESKDGYHNLLSAIAEAWSRKAHLFKAQS